MRKGLQSRPHEGETVPKWNGHPNSIIRNEFARSYQCHEMSFRVRSCHLPIFRSPRREAMAAHSLQSWQQQRGTSWAEKDGERLIAEGLGRPLRSTAPLLHFGGTPESSSRPSLACDPTTLPQLVEIGTFPASRRNRA